MVPPNDTRRRWLRWLLLGLLPGCGGAGGEDASPDSGHATEASSTGPTPTTSAAATTSEDTSTADADAIDSGTTDADTIDTGTTDTGDEPPAPSVPCSECFPLEQLPEDLRLQAEALLLLALDREALYTIAADIKPMSTGFAELSYPAADPPPPELEELRTILGTFTCTSELTAEVQVFHSVFDGVAFADGVVFHTPRVHETVDAFAELFAAIGVTADASPIDIVDAVDADPTTRRFRGYGHLFGYPEYAVDFFAEAAEEEAMTGMFVERDFIHIPTFESDEGRFVYAVPVGHRENADDIELRSRAMPVLEQYSELRAATIGDGKPGVLHLVRTWFDDGSGQCSPRHALAKVDM